MKKLIEAEHGVFVLSDEWILPTGTKLPLPSGGKITGLAGVMGGSSIGVRHPITGNSFTSFTHGAIGWVGFYDGNTYTKAVQIRIDIAGSVITATALQAKCGDGDLTGKMAWFDGNGQASTIATGDGIGGYGISSLEFYRGSKPETKALGSDKGPDLSPARGWDIKGGVLKCAAIREKMPSQGLTLAVTLVMNQSQEWDGFAGFWQDNGSYEKGYYLGANNGKVYIAVSTEGKLVRATSPDPIKPGEVIHACGTWDGHRLRLYLNGVEVAATPLTGYAELPPDTDFIVGGYHDADEHWPFNGYLRNLYLSHKAASAAEVKKMADSNKEAQP